MGHVLSDIYLNDGYQFFYVALVSDLNPKAVERITDFNFAGYPTVIFDGGDDAFVGGSQYPGDYTPLIENSGYREVTNLDLNLDMTWIDRGQIQLDLNLTNYDFFNDEPDEPTEPIAESDGSINIEYNFFSTTTDPEDENIYFRFDYGDGTITEWLGPYESGDTCFASHTWLFGGYYSVMVQAKDIIDQETEWVASSEINIHQYLCGDASGDFNVNILDIVFLINYLYKDGSMPDPYAAGDANGNVVINILDIVYLIDFLYKGGPVPVYSE